ncbi:MAG: hypothetical protein LBP40_02635 [Campylobacteraceae bacterium]|jgi:hypothetical protein|nr:hypothetical protein [Campylobacteraceae bacterium]
METVVIDGKFVHAKTGKALECVGFKLLDVSEPVLERLANTLNDGLHLENEAGRDIKELLSKDAAKIGEMFQEVFYSDSYGRKQRA